MSAEAKGQWGGPRKNQRGRPRKERSEMGRQLPFRVPLARYAETVEHVKARSALTGLRPGAVIADAIAAMPPAPVPMPMPNPNAP